MENGELRTALDRDWATSDAHVFEAELRIFREDAVLEYPRSGERIPSRFAQPDKKRRRMLGAANVWITEAILTYDGRVAVECPERCRFVSTVLP
ncbi:hypothetical protein [Pseudaminobacter soli (ex Li et al. 2025)]|uniref:Uncharacterized protein n=1 Tax=Pseudaminobacter soli (ex Li et al. 2025) TaxID=1295366 RepID=A0A2P7RMH7_9HYPH|nr:hypothetical protein [Mesorhizobium soli]PSJ51424.1 hypothetical protein C7I85_29415 [Mesorhizobium soli]